MTGKAEPMTTDLVQAAAGPGPLQTRILDLWRQIRIDWAFAARGLRGALGSAGDLNSTKRRFVGEVLFGMIRHLTRLDEALAAGGLRAGAIAPDAMRLLAYLVLEGGLSVEVAGQSSGAAGRIDWSAVASIDDALGRRKKPARRIAALYSLPDWLAAQLVRDLGDRAEPLAAALNHRGPTTVRANLLQGGVDDLAGALAAEGIESAPGRYSSTALILDTRANLRGLGLFAGGRFEAQDEGSQLVADLTAAKLPDRGLVVDVCAGAGGKTLALSAAMANRGRVVAADVDSGKLKELRRRAKRAGVANVHSVRLDPDGGYPSSLEGMAGTADRVLVDAPCSGLGALRRNPEQRWRLTRGDLRALPDQQLEIAARAVKLLAGGGVLVYATCTLLDAENRALVRRLLEASPQLEIVPIAELLGSERSSLVADDSGQFLEVFPSTHGTDGFFAAALRNTSC